MIVTYQVTDCIVLIWLVGKFWEQTLFFIMSLLLFSLGKVLTSFSEIDCYLLTIHTFWWHFFTFEHSCYTKCGWWSPDFILLKSINQRVLSPKIKARELLWMFWFNQKVYLDQYWLYYSFTTVVGSLASEFLGWSWKNHVGRNTYVGHWNSY